MKNIIKNTKHVLKPVWAFYGTSPSQHSSVKELPLCRRQCHCHLLNVICVIYIAVLELRQTAAIDKIVNSSIFSHPLAATST